MYERNESVVPEKTREPRPRSTKRGAVELGRGRRTPAVSAHLSAGMLENNRMKRPQTAMDFFLSMARAWLAGGHGDLAPAVLQQRTRFASDGNNLFGGAASTSSARSGIGCPRTPASEELFADNKLYAPRVIPKHIAVVKDLPNVPQTMRGMPGGVIGGVPGGQLGGVLGGILGDMGHIVPAAPSKGGQCHHGPYLVGGRVQAPSILREVQPIYPALAREARIHGTVVMDSVIDANGNVTQLQLVSGHPLAGHGGVRCGTAMEVRAHTVEWRADCVRNGNHGAFQSRI